MAGEQNSNHPEQNPNSPVQNTQANNSVLNQPGTSQSQGVEVGTSQVKYLNNKQDRRLMKAAGFTEEGIEAYFQARRDRKADLVKKSRAARNDRKKVKMTDEQRSKAANQKKAVYHSKTLEEKQDFNKQRYAKWKSTATPEMLQRTKERQKHNRKALNARRAAEPGSLPEHQRYLGRLKEKGTLQAFKDRKAERQRQKLEELKKDPENYAKYLEKNRKNQIAARQKLMSSFAENTSVDKIIEQVVTEASNFKPVQTKEPKVSKKEVSAEKPKNMTPSERYYAKKAKMTPEQIKDLNKKKYDWRKQKLDKINKLNPDGPKLSLYTSHLKSLEQRGLKDAFLERRKEQKSKDYYKLKENPERYERYLARKAERARERYANNQSSASATVSKASDVDNQLSMDVQQPRVASPVIDSLKDTAFDLNPSIPVQTMNQQYSFTPSASIDDPGFDSDSEIIPVQNMNQQPSFTHSARIPDTGFDSDSEIIPVGVSSDITTSINKNPGFQTNQPSGTNKTMQVIEQAVLKQRGDLSVKSDSNRSSVITSNKQYKPLVQKSNVAPQTSSSSMSSYQDALRKQVQQQSSATSHKKSLLARYMNENGPVKSPKQSL